VVIIGWKVTEACLPIIPAKLKYAAIRCEGEDKGEDVVNITSYFRGFLVENDPTHLEESTWYGS
jgi:hypothetical protein